MINTVLNNKGKLTTFLNPFSYMLVRENKSQLSHFNIQIDGGILVQLLNVFGFKSKRRSFDMTSLAPIVFENAIERNKTIYFIGTKPLVIDKAIDNIQLQFPELNICGFRHGYFNFNERERVFLNIKKLNADIVVCGMGTPLQEQFLIDLQSSGWKGEGYTCGGFLHQTANGIEYYPKWITKYGLRAFYRMYDEPKLIRRYFYYYPWALLLYIYDSYQYNMDKRNS